MSSQNTLNKIFSHFKELNEEEEEEDEEEEDKYYYDKKNKKKEEESNKTNDLNFKSENNILNKKKEKENINDNKLRENDVHNKKDSNMTVDNSEKKDSLYEELNEDKKENNNNNNFNPGTPKLNENKIINSNEINTQNGSGNLKFFINNNDKSYNEDDIQKSNIFLETINTRIEDNDNNRIIYIQNNNKDNNIKDNNIKDNNIKDSNIQDNIQDNNIQDNIQYPNHHHFFRQTFKMNDINSHNVYEKENISNNINSNNEDNIIYNESNKNNFNEENSENEFLNNLENEKKIKDNYKYLEKEEKNKNIIEDKIKEENNKEEINKYYSELNEENDRIIREKKIINYDDNNKEENLFNNEKHINHIIIYPKEIISNTLDSSLKLNKLNKYNEMKSNKKNKKGIKKNLTPSYSDNHLINKNNFIKSKTPIKIKNKKEREKYLNDFKMNKSSYKILFQYNEKLINKIINNYLDINNKLTIVGIAKCLSELKIFRELLNIENNKNNNDNFKEIDLKKLKYIIDNIKVEEKRKEKEVDFLEQIWFNINPKNKEFINKEIFEGLIKLLFSYSNNLNTKEEIISYIKEYLNIIHFMGANNNIKNEYFFSPLRNKNISKEIWSEEKIIDKFLELKKHLIAYESNYYQKENLNNIIKERERQYSNDKYKNNKNKKEKKEKYNFNRLYESFKNKKLIREKTLEKIREIQEKEEISMLQEKPKINKDLPPYLRNNMKNSILSQISIHEKLYKMKDDKQNNILKLREKYEDKEKEEEMNKTFFKPIKYSNNKLINDFNNNIKPENPKGYQKYIKKNLSFIKKKESERLKEEEKYIGKNYEKIKKMNILPPKIKDINKFNKDEIKKLYEKNNLLLPDFMNNENDNSNNEDFYTVEIKIPNGKKVNMKINHNEDIDKKIENFCKIYSLNDKVKRKLIKKILEYKNYYYNDDDEKKVNNF